MKDTDIMTARYQRAANLMQGIHTKRLVRNTVVFPIWIEESDCFWYVRDTKIETKSSASYGKEYRLVNARASTNEVAFDHYALATALAESAEHEVDATDLPISNVNMALTAKDISIKQVSEVSFTAYGGQWLFNTTALTCKAINTIANNERMSPDGKKVVFRRENNLWIRHLDTCEESPLTLDGEEDYVYGAPGSAWGVEHELDQRPQALWSPDSKQIFTLQRDTRKVKTTPTVYYVPKDGTFRPRVKFNKVALPGDEHIETSRLVAINCEAGHIQEVDYKNIPTTRNGFGFFSSGLGWWATDSRRAYFIELERGYKKVRLIEFNTATGATRVLFEETTKTHINLMLNNDERPSFVSLPETNELLWFSERTGWAHLYLYDLDTGELKNVVTQGEWLVRDVIHVDLARREVFVQTAGRERDRDPYYRDLCRINLDTSEIITLVSSDHDYWAVGQKNMNTFLAVAYGHDAGAACGVSPSGNYAVITRARADEAPITQLVDRQSEIVLGIEVADISDLPCNWQWPEPLKLLAADKKTDIYGLIFRPSDFADDNSYPIVCHVFGTPEVPFVSKGSFCNGTAFGWAYLEAAALAELGFIVLQLDTRGTPCRHKAFHDESYGWAESACNLDDYISSIKQLSKYRSYIDINRVGITSHSTGGPGGVQGLLKHPEFFKVGVNGMLHDSRLQSASMWGEKFHGISGPKPGRLFPEELADNLQGKLLMMQGMLDRPATMLRLVDALHYANKDFDMILLPNFGHEVSGYLIRRAWDYLVRHLLNKEPPKEFTLMTAFDSNLSMEF